VLFADLTNEESDTDKKNDDANDANGELRHLDRRTDGRQRFHGCPIICSTPPKAHVEPSRRRVDESSEANFSATATVEWIDQPVRDDLYAESREHSSRDKRSVLGYASSPAASKAAPQLPK